MAYLEVLFVVVCLYGFWCHVVNGATADVSFNARLLCLNAVGYPEVNKPQPCPNTDKVLGLQVVVDDSLIVDHLQTQEGG